MFTRKTAPALAALTALALAFTGCAAGSTPSASDSASATSDSPSGEPVEGGVLAAVLLTEPRNLEPGALQNNNRTTALVGNALYGTLLTADADTAEIEPSLAESFTTDDGGTTFELTLQAGLTFTDGTALDAEAVKFNWERAQDPEVASNALQDASLIAALTVEDAQHLQVTLSTPTPRYGNNITLSPLNWIASPTAIAAGTEAFDAKPVGAGPFTLKTWTRGGSLELVKNADYYDAPKPYLDGITVQFAGDANQRLNALTAGDADVTMIDNWGVAAKATDAGLQVDTMPISGGQYFALNTATAPFDDVRARQALSYALDLDTFNSIVNDGKGEVATSLFADASPLANDVALHTYDPKKAQELFTELAGEGKPVSFTFTTFTGSENIGEAIQSLLSAYTDVTVEVTVAAWADTGKVLGQKQFQATLAAASFQEPDTVLPRAFLSTSKRNSVSIASPELDAAIQAGSTATDTADRVKAYAEVSTLLADLVPGIFYQREPLIAVATKKVGGVTLYGQGSLRADLLWLAE